MKLTQVQKQQLDDYKKAKAVVDLYVESLERPSNMFDHERFIVIPHYYDKYQNYIQLPQRGEVAEALAFVRNNSQEINSYMDLGDYTGANIVSRSFKQCFCSIERHSCGLVKTR